MYAARTAFSALLFIGFVALAARLIFLLTGLALLAAALGALAFEVTIAAYRSSRRHR